MCCHVNSYSLWWFCSIRASSIHFSFKKIASKTGTVCTHISMHAQNRCGFNHNSFVHIHFSTIFEKNRNEDRLPYKHFLIWEIPSLSPNRFGKTFFFLLHANHSQIIEIVISNWCDGKSIEFFKYKCVMIVLPYKSKSHVEWCGFLLRLFSFFSFCLHTHFIRYFSYLFQVLKAKAFTIYIYDERWRENFQ